MLLSWWVPVITGVAAFVGAILAQLLGIIRWRWEREEEREKDRIAWKREDKYRFAEYKRKLYADVITYIVSSTVEVARYAVDLGKAEASGNEPPEPPDFLNLQMAVAEAFLIAPEDIRDLAADHFQELMKMANHASASKAPRKMSFTPIEPLRALMRADLGETSATVPSSASAAKRNITVP